MDTRHVGYMSHVLPLSLSAPMPHITNQDTLPLLTSDKTSDAFSTWYFEQTLIINWN